MGLGFEIPNFYLGVLKANADLSAKQYYAVDVVNSSGEGKIDLPGASGDPVIGVLQNNPISGEAATVMTQGVTKMICGASVTAGDKVMTDAAGKARTATSALYSLGRALESGAASEVISVLLSRNGKV